MTYYAVTNDPNELAHFGIKGMKWGVRKERPRHTGSRRPRSAAYKKASSKLGMLMKSGIRKAETKWKVYKSPENAAKRAAKRYEKQTERAIEKARKGKLKYGKLDDWQVQRITQRLAMENDARRLSETEKTFGKRLRESIGEGIIGGIGQGFGRMASERISRGSVLKTDRMRMEQQAEFDKAKEERQIRNDIKRENAKAENIAKNARKQAKRDAEAEYIKMRIEEGDDVGFRNRIANRLPGATQRRINYLYNTKERRDTANDLKERAREQRKVEASLAQDVAKAKVDRAWKSYENQMNAYTTDLKEWRKAGSVGPRPVAPKVPRLTSSTFYTEYDRTRKRRGLT